jgi:glyoxylase-like metal-dependent hydrolase (beta-lactamase superfamily II)
LRLKLENPKLQVWAHPLGKPMIEDIDAQYRRRPVPAYYTLMGGSVPVSRVLEDGERIDIGFEVRAVYTPGHSDDSLSLYLPEEKLIISGDAIPYVRDLPIYEDLPALKASLSRLKALSSDFVLSAFCGLWNQKEQGDVFAVTGGYLAKIQAAVDEFQKMRPNAPSRRRPLCAAKNRRGGAAHSHLSRKRQRTHEKGTAIQRRLFS